ncbi:MAG: hypothetical protein RDU13_11075 [Elusimicrobiales bacterium]|jgi:hypothetical protein|nr:hypothetical protein [Elusimicrobiales bacterium]
MSRLIPLLFSFFLVFTALAETTHCHSQSADAPCPAVCLGAPCASYCENASAGPVAPADNEKPAASAYVKDFVPLLSEDEIFHPPVV